MVVLLKMIFLDGIFLVRLVAVHASYRAIQYRECQAFAVPTISMCQSNEYKINFTIVQTLFNVNEI